MPPQDPPPARVLAAFGLTDPVRRLHGGLGGAWRAGDVVLKRAELDPAWLEWEARVLERVDDGHGFRVQRLRRARDGSLSVLGWVARDHLAGSPRPGRWLEIIEAGDAFHRATSELDVRVVLPLPAPRNDAWAQADRITWDEAPFPARLGSPDRDLGALLEARRPVVAPPQVLHGDLTGNVVFEDGLAPGIIDFSPYWRPATYSIGVVIADAVTWEGADLSILRSVEDRPEIGQCLLRALIFRHLTALILPGPQPRGDAAARYRDLSEAVIKIAAS